MSEVLGLSREKIAQNLYELNMELALFKDNPNNDAISELKQKIKNNTSMLRLSYIYEFTSKLIKDYRELKEISSNFVYE